MYLSKCLLKSIKPINYYRLHKELWTFFPGIRKESRPFLFRVNNPNQKCEKKILLQSIIQPKTTSKQDLILLQETKNISKNLSLIQNNQPLRFLLAAYPSKRINSERLTINNTIKTTNQGKVRVPLIKEDALRNWLIRQLKKHDGASLEKDQFQIKDRYSIQFRKPLKNGNKSHFGKIDIVTFTGILIVKNTQNLIDEQLSKGVGPKKAFGCGLLSLTKI